MKYQFCVDGRPVGPVRRLWDSAAWDAVDAGVAVWVNNTEIRMNDMAEIYRIEDDD